MGSCEHQGRVRPCRSRSRRRIGIDLDSIWNDDVFSHWCCYCDDDDDDIGNSRVFCFFCCNKTVESCTMDSSQLCAAHCQWPDDSFNARHIKHQQQHQKCNRLHDFHLEWQKLSLLRLFSPLLPSLPGSP